MLQAIAAGWHHKSKEEIRKLGDRVGRGRILVAHGGGDKIVPLALGLALAREVGEEKEEEEGRKPHDGKKPGVRLVVMEGTGHVLLMEQRSEFRTLIASMIDRQSSYPPS